MNLRTFFWWAWALGGWTLFLATYWDGKKPEKEFFQEVTPVPAVSALPKAPPPPPKVQPQKMVNEARKVAPLSIDESLRTATRLAQQQEPEKAIEILKKTLESHPESADHIEAQIGLLYSRQLGQPEKSIPHFENSLLKNPNQPDVLSELVTNYGQSNNSKQAEPFLKRLTQDTHPKAAGPALAYADWLSTQGRAGEAILNLERKAPQLENAWEAYAMAANLSSREAQRARSNPQNAEEANQAAQFAARSISNSERAISYLEAQVREKGVTSAAPRRSLYEVRYSLASQLMQMNKPEAALQQIQLIKSATSLDPEIRSATLELEKELEKRILVR